MSKVKYPLEYVFDNTGLHATSSENVRNNKIVDPGLVTKHRCAGFVEEVDNGTAGSVMPINWNKGNYHKFKTRTDGDGQWVSFSNPGNVGRYHLVITKSIGAHEILAFGDGSNEYTNIDWPYGYINYLSYDTNEEIIITFIWDGERYTAIPISEPKVSTVITEPGTEPFTISIPPYFNISTDINYIIPNLGVGLPNNSVKIYSAEQGPNEKTLVYQTSQYHNNPWNGKPYTGLIIKNILTLETQYVPTGWYILNIWSNQTYTDPPIYKSNGINRDFGFYVIKP